MMTDSLEQKVVTIVIIVITIFDDICLHMSAKYLKKLPTRLGRSYVIPESEWISVTFDIHFDLESYLIKSASH